MEETSQTNAATAPRRVNRIASLETCRVEAWLHNTTTSPNSICTSSAIPDSHVSPRPMLWVVDRRRQHRRRAPRSSGRPRSVEGPGGLADRNRLL